jgi:hypothetical protein
LHTGGVRQTPDLIDLRFLKLIPRSYSRSPPLPPGA